MTITPGIFIREYCSLSQTVKKRYVQKVLHQNNGAGKP